MLIQSMIVAFSMYSKIPMPKIQWNEKNMHYALCFFPAVGAVVGIGMYLLMWICEKVSMGNLFRACAATVLPVVITGGIHLDGYLDTIDALHSYGDREKRLEILKDSNSGAFAIIFGLVYFVLSVGIWSEISLQAMPFLCISYTISRTLSGFSMVTFPLAKNTGLVAAFQEGADKRKVIVVLALLFTIEALLLFSFNVWMGVFVMVPALLCFLYHYYVCKRIFGGITGDLAGYFLQICELVMAAGIMFAGSIKVI